MFNQGGIYSGFKLDATDILHHSRVSYVCYCTLAKSLFHKKNGLLNPYRKIYTLYCYLMRSQRFNSDMHFARYNANSRLSRNQKIATAIRSMKLLIIGIQG